MEDLRVSVVGICYSGRSGFKVFSPVLQPFGLFFLCWLSTRFPSFFIDIKVSVEEKENVTNLNLLST